MLFQLEQQFGVSVALDEIEVESFSSVERIVDFIKSQRQAASGG